MFVIYPYLLGPDRVAIEVTCKPPIDFSAYRVWVWPLLRSKWVVELNQHAFVNCIAKKKKYAEKFKEHIGPSWSCSNLHQQRIWSYISKDFWQSPCWESDLENKVSLISSAFRYIAIKENECIIMATWVEVLVADLHSSTTLEHYMRSRVSGLTSSIPLFLFCFRPLQ